jgi:hypothetical protein
MLGVSHVDSTVAELRGHTSKLDQENGTEEKNWTDTIKESQIFSPASRRHGRE